MRTLIVLLALVVLGGSGCTSFDEIEALRQENVDLLQRNTALMREIAALEAEVMNNEMREQERLINDMTVIVIDNAGFINRGIVGFGDAVFGELSAEMYRLDRLDGFLNVATGEWVSVNVQQGETLVLYTYSHPDGKEEVVYYTYYTNGMYKYVDPIMTGIFVP